MEDVTADQKTRPTLRFSLVSLLLATALVAVSVSHIQTSRRLSVAQSALTIAQNELGVLTIEDAKDVHAIALPSPMPQINHDSPPGRKTRFSLASLLLIVTVLALAISYYLKSREMEDAKKELVEYRFQHGNLVVDDATKPHLLTYVDQQNPWKWYAFFPAKKKYRIMSGVGTIDTDKVPDASGLQHVGVLEVVGKGELTTLSVTLRDLDAKTVELKVAHDNASISRAFPKKDVPWLAKDNATSKSSGHKEQFVGESDNPFVIFWSRKPKITRTATSTMVTLDTAPTDGIAVWAVPVN